MLDQVPVLPGASMSLEVRFALTRGSGQASVFDGNDKEAPFNYHHEKQRFSKRILSAASAVSGSILATREGLVGHTTANGHVIQSHDHFVALPSGRSLAPNGSYAFQVTISANGRTANAPVWDVGPWNTRDDYWSPSSSRQMWNDLPQMLPEAQAAFYNHYNGGHDEFGRSPTNGAGIDIADGTFWDDLGLAGNSWVNVQYLWTNTPPAGLRPVVSSSLTLSSGGPYYVGQYIYGYFTITNRGSQPITFQRLLIGGRLNGDQTCAGGCPDFSSLNYITLSAGQSYGYSGYQYLSRAGTYSFFVAYQRMDGGWITSVDTDPGVRASLGITVQNNAHPVLNGQSPTYVYSSWFPQAMTLYGQQLANTSAMYIQFPNGTGTYIYPPFQIYSRSYNQLSFIITFNTRGWHYLWAYTPDGGWSNYYSLWVN